jgi:hypothetical protein
MDTTTVPTPSLQAALATAATVRTVDPRDERARAIAADAGQWIKLRFTDGRKAYGVPSQSEANVFHVTDGRTCTCKDYQRRQQPCKHARAVRLHVARVKAAQYDAIFGGDA